MANLAAERIEITEKLHNSLDFNILAYNHKVSINNTSFNNVINAATLFEQVGQKNRKIANAERMK